MIVRNLLILVGLLAIFFPINCQGILYSNYKILYNARRSYLTVTIKLIVVILHCSFKNALHDK